PDIFYRYGDFENEYFINIITKRTLYFNHPKNFSDLNDCSSRIYFDKDKITDCYSKFFLQNPLWKRDMANSLARYNYKMNFGDAELKNERMNEFHKRFNNILGILCTTDNNNNPYLWQKYSNSFKGFCVGFDMKNQILWNSGFSLNKVAYWDELPVLEYPFYEIEQESDDPLNSQFYHFLLEFIFNKLKISQDEVYKLEKEWRFAKLLIAEKPGIGTELQRVFQLPSHAFREIIFGYEMHKSVRMNIKKIAEQQGLNVEFKVAVPNINNTVTIEPES
ncbi:MAG: hypothetical protein LH606_13180, partial [Cytophagaceae bacterium]|nr:hypothetical protein [Cytophagaceae bacterium]